MPLINSNTLNELANGLLDTRLQDIANYEPGYRYGTLLPIRVNEKTKEKQLAVPGIFKDIARAISAPKRAYEGEIDFNSPEGIQEAANFAMMANVPGAGKAVVQPKTLVQPGTLNATVWHGSPHKFDKFDMSKIGTGEGAQAYGHGLYFAEAPDVAKGYQRTLAMDKKANDLNTRIKMVDVGGNSLESYGVDMMPEMVDAARNGTLADLAAQRRESWLRNATDPDYPFQQYAQDKIAAYDRLIADAQKGNVSYTGDGALYKVDIPDEILPRMLDWDKPLSEQNPYVLDALQKAGISVDKKALGEFDDALLNALQGGPTTLPKQPLNPAGESIYRKLGGQNVAAEKLKALGVPGIRYLDQASRVPGQGTSNFVLFDDQLPRILEINGVPTGAQPWQPGELKGLLAPR